MSWKDQMLPASFAGVPFWVDTATVPVGRRGQLHEFPQCDQPFFEDLGQQAPVHELAGFLVGADCFTQRDRLLAALRGGQGELVHPWLGPMSVKVGECKVDHARSNGGYVALTLKFHADSQKPFPEAAINPGDWLRSVSLDLLADALDRFSEAMAQIDRVRINLVGLRNGLESVYQQIQSTLRC